MPNALQNVGIFDPSNTSAYKSLIQMQIGNLTTGPTQSGMSSGTNLLIPDLDISARIKHFQSDLYDLSDDSHLMRFMRALLGDAGTGQLRKLQTVQHLASALTSTHFFDLDRFYGAIFGATREADELFAYSPATTPASPDEWADIMAADSAFREKILGLARAIAMGATRAGMTALAEAILGAPVSLYEDWQILDPLGRDDVGPDNQNDPTFEVTWALVASTYANYGAMQGILWGNLAYHEAAQPVPVNPYPRYTWTTMPAAFSPDGTYAPLQDYTWAELGSYPVAPPVPAPSIPLGDRFGFHVVPLKTYDDPSDVVNLTQRSGDVFEITRVLRRLKPAGSLMSVDPQGLTFTLPVQIANLAAASSYWDIRTTVVPKSANKNLYPVSNGQAAAGVLATQEHEPPVYAWQGSQVTEWNYNGDVIGVSAYREDATGTVVDQTNYQVVTYYDGTQVSYTADQAVLSAANAWAATNAKAVSASPILRTS